MAELGATSGHVTSQLVLARLYSQGLGVAKDPSKAFSLYYQAAGLAGNSEQKTISHERLEATYMVAQMYLRGEGVEKDIIKYYPFLSIVFSFLLLHSLLFSFFFFLIWSFLFNSLLFVEPQTCLRRPLNMAIQRPVFSWRNKRGKKDNTHPLQHILRRRQQREYLRDSLDWQESMTRATAGHVIH